MLKKTLSALALTAAFATTAFAQVTTSLDDVTGLAAENTEAGVLLTWDAVENADSYTIYYGKTSVVEADDFYDDQVYSEFATAEYVLTGLDAETTYYFSVAAEDSTGVYAGSPNYSEEASVTTVAAPAVETEEDLNWDEFVGEESEENLTTEIAALEEAVAAEEVVEEEKEAAPTELTQSGPLTAALVAGAAGAAALIRRRALRK